MENTMFPWNFNVPMIVLTALLLAFHLITNRYALTKRSIAFFSGLFLIILATVSPLDYLGHHYLFSAHMTQHIIMLLIVPPLLLSGTDARFFEKVLKNKSFHDTANILFHPVTAWIIGVGSMWLWHIPALFNAMMHSSFLHLVHMLSLIICGLIFIWPVFSPVSYKRLGFLQRVLYLATACVGCTILGIFITFTSPGLYTAYINITDPAIARTITGRWGITKAADQQIGGLIMWVPACLIYFTYIMISLLRWYNLPDKLMTGKSK